jgi:histidine triad (HIT) family protein
MLASPCVFCRVIAGTVPAHVIVDEPELFALLDHRPLFAGHVLLLPRQHHETLMDLPSGQVAGLFGAAQRLSSAVERAMEADGVFVAINNRVSQSVPHLHVHVVPRRKKDGLRGFFWPRVTYASDAEMVDVAARIREALASRNPHGARDD